MVKTEWNRRTARARARNLSLSFVSSRRKKIILNEQQRRDGTKKCDCRIIRSLPFIVVIDCDGSRDAKTRCGIFVVSFATHHTKRPVKRRTKRNESKKNGKKRKSQWKGKAYFCRSSSELFPIFRAITFCSKRSQTQTPRQTIYSSETAKRDKKTMRSW